MKSYQDHDPLHGNGKAMPHPNTPTRYTYRGRRFNNHITIMASDRNQLRLRRESEVASGKSFMSVLSMIGVALGLIGPNWGRQRRGFTKR